MGMFCFKPRDSLGNKSVPTTDEALAITIVDFLCFKFHFGFARFTCICILYGIMIMVRLGIIVDECVYNNNMQLTLNWHTIRKTSSEWCVMLKSNGNRCVSRALYISRSDLFQPILWRSTCLLGTSASPSAYRHQIIWHCCWGIRHADFADQLINHPLPAFLIFLSAFHEVVHAPNLRCRRSDLTHQGLSLCSDPTS